MTRLHAWERPHGGASRRLNAGRGAVALSLLSLSLLGAIAAQAQQAPPSGNEAGTLPPLPGAAAALPPVVKPDAKDASPDAIKPTVPPDGKTDGKTETPPTKAPAAKVAPGYEPVPVDYRLALGDAIYVQVVRHPELSGEAYILPDGNVVLPVIRQMNVQGLTIAQVSDRVQAALRTEINNPRVYTRVTRRAPREASVLGNGIRSQGRRALGDDYRILQLISESGGLAGEPIRPEFINAVLFRKGEAYKIDIAKLLEGDASQNRLVLDNDVFYVTVQDQSKITVTVQGRVNRPGDVIFPKDGSIQTVMKQVGAPLPDALLSQVKLVRGDNSIINIDMRDLLKTGEVKPDIPLKPGDVIIVPENKRRYAVLGAVSKAGEFMYPDDQKLTVLTALSISGNLSSDADLKKAGIFRKDENGKAVVIPVDLEKLGNPTKKTSSKTTKSKPSKAKAEEAKAEKAKADEANADPSADKTGAAKTGGAKTDATSGAKVSSTAVSKQVATIDTELLPDDQLVVPRKGTGSGFNLREVLSYVTSFALLRNLTR